MLFFLKQSKIIVDFFTTHRQVLESTPPQPTRNFIPEWYKKLPNHSFVTTPSDITVPTPTIKTCPAVIEYFKLGFVVPMWEDLYIKGNHEYFRCVGPHKETDITVHSQIGKEGNYAYDQTIFPSDFYKDYTGFKINMPWYAKEKSGVTFLTTPFFYEKKLHPTLEICQGTINFKDHCNVNVNVFTKLGNDEQVLIPQGYPIVCFFPLADKKIEIKTHLISDEEKRKMFSYGPFTLVNQSFKLKKLIQGVKNGRH